MKTKISAIILFIAVLLSSCSNENEVVIKGSYLTDNKNEFLDINLVQGAETFLIDSVKINGNGTFKVKFELDAPELITIRNNENEPLNLIAAPGERIYLDINKSSFRSGYNVDGSKTSADIQMLVSEVEETKLVLDSILKEINMLDDTNSDKGQELADEYMEVFRAQKNFNLKYILENLNSLASVYALYQRVAADIYLFNEIKDLQYFKIVADSVKVKYPESFLAQSLVNDVTQRLDQFNRVTAINRLTENNVVETGMINLEIENTEGTPVSLRSLKGDVVLLVFWASWNEQSRETNRILKSIYQQYHQRGFEIYAVGLEQDRNTWRRAVDYEEYPWINVSELSYPYSYAANMYNVKEIPANFLIDREGNIVAKNINGSMLTTWLDNLL